MGTLGKSMRLSATSTHRSIDRSNDLAVDRTVLATERTYAAWIRTGIASLVCGAGARSLLAGQMPLQLIQWVASIFVVGGMGCFVAGIWREVRAANVWSSADVVRIPSSILYVANGLLLVVASLVLVGIWAHLRAS